MKSAYPLKTPHGWKESPLSDLLLEGKERNALGKDYPVYSVTNSKGFVPQVDQFARAIHSRETNKYKVFRRGDFGYNPARINVGSIALHEEQNIGLLSPMYVVFRTTNELLPEYLKHWVQTPVFNKQVVSNTAGSVRESLNFSGFKNFPFQYPIDLSEQRAIARILNNVDGLISTAEALSEKTQRIREGLINDLFRFGIDEQGNLRKEKAVWPMVPVGTFAEVSNGTTPAMGKKDYWENGTVPWITSGKINEYVVSTPSDFVTKRALKETSLKLFPKGTVLLAMVGQGKTRGMSARLGFASTINQNLAGIIPSARVDSRFLHYYLGYRYNDLRAIGRGSNQNALTCSLIKEYAVPLPPRDEQERISNLLFGLEVQIREKSQRKTKLRALKDALTADLLTGKVRVKVPQK